MSCISQSHKTNVGGAVVGAAAGVVHFFAFASWCGSLANCLVIKKSSGTLKVDVGTIKIHLPLGLQSTFVYCNLCTTIMYVRSGGMGIPETRGSGYPQSVSCLLGKLDTDFLHFLSYSMIFQNTRAQLWKIIKYRL